MPAALALPSWLHPALVPGLPFRWLGLLLAAAVALTWLLVRYEARRRAGPWGGADLGRALLWGLLGLVLGARLTGTLLYAPAGAYLSHPWLILWPFDATGRFQGFRGLSFEGGLLGLCAATFAFAKARRLPWLALADLVAVAAPFGVFLGRLGNFANGELWGRVSEVPWAMVFPQAPSFSAREPWVQEFANRAGIPVSSMNDWVNLPRHPSQLYEALLEGLVLGLALWLFVRKREGRPGLGLGAYLLGYGFLRFVCEYFRAPDPGLGYILALGDPQAPYYLLTTPWNFTMGQVMAAAMMAAGGLVLWLVPRAATGRPRKDPASPRT